MAPFQMALTHPIDAEVRARLKAAVPHQAEFAAAIGRSSAWLNKYMHGAGTATIDDVVRMMALLIGVTNGPALSKPARKLLRALQQLPAEEQEDGAEFFAAWVQTRQRRRQHEQSTEPTARTSPAVKRRGHGKR
jgi:transcriptional regulator with XRE-family HTH domain